VIRSILIGLVEAFIVVLIVRALLSWFPVRPGSPVLGLQRALGMITEPILRPIRRILPPVRAGGMAIDLSIILVILLAQALIIPILRA
jgi:YggT family protein